MMLRLSPRSLMIISSNTVTNMSDDEQFIRDGECVKDIYDDFEYHQSILSIKSRNYPTDAFSFEEINEDVVLKLVRSLDRNKATGHDNIPAALLKSSTEELALPMKILSIGLYGMQNFHMI